MIQLLILLVVLLLATAFFSGTETALFSLSRYDLNRLRRGGDASGRLVAHLLERPRRLLLTLMVGGVTVNLLIFAASLALFELLPGRAGWLAPLLGLVSPVVLTLLGDILPKSVAITAAPTLAARAAPIIEALQKILAPVVIVLNALVTPLTRLLTSPRPASAYVTVEELAELISMSERHRIIGSDENAMLSEALELGRLRVRDIMVPRVDMVAFEVHDDPDVLRQLIRERGFAKLPIYEEDIDHVLGLIYAKDLFLYRDRPLRGMLRPVRFVPAMITLTQLLAHFRRTGTQLAIGVDEYGGVVGLVTVEDVAAQIVGELAPPEPDAPRWEKLDERTYRVSGSISIRDWAEEFGVQLLDEQVTTLGGLIVTRLGRPAEVGDRMQLGNLSLTVEALRGRRIEWIRLELATPDQARPAPGGLK